MSNQVEMVATHLYQLRPTDRRILSRLPYWLLLTSLLFLEEKVAGTDEEYRVNRAKKFLKKLPCLKGFR